MLRKPFLIIGAAFSIGGAHTGNRCAPLFYRHHQQQSQRTIRWRTIVWQNSTTLRSYPYHLSYIQCANRQLSHHICQISSHFTPLILAGDHSSAIATWQAIAKRPLGLLWIDAHFDSHTPDTSMSHRLHGMPLAILLQQGQTPLFWRKTPAILSKYTVVFGVRSFEPEEILLLTQLGIRYYLMSEIKQRGFYTCFDEAWQLVSKAPHGFGVSLDLDSIDPTDMPAVSVKSPNGLSFNKLVIALKKQKKYKLKGIEIAEFNPYYQFHGNSVKKISQLIQALVN